MSRHPTIKQLRYLCSVVEHGHFGRAAKACHVSQSTLSAGILELEEVLGASLLERNNRSLVLTGLGEEVVERARGLLLDVEDLVALCQASAEPLSGRLRLGVIPTIAPFLLPGLLKSLRSDHPEFTPFIREDLTEPLVDALHRGELDLLLLALPVQADGVESMHLFDDPFFLASPVDHPLAAKSDLDTGDLQGQELLLLEDGHCLRDHALEACKLRGREYTVPYQATSLTTVVQMVASGIGVTLVPGMAVTAGALATADVTVTPFADPSVKRDIGLMWRKKTPRQTEFRLLGEYIMKRQDQG
ncbi:hydrogen peroxide-inducible genes activator [Congregibacter litoralis]|uniref:Transcriptional regulator n=1 Tax=Congregibacter litoralis KT71 TaxID=314285 RepID=A4A3P1_9GAMM|nr:hydrogen peroxide-inducible genes activator [Congregibacter litoralis]EAQ99314.1 transcriptional regulator [Congregibacter litoralis KT71]